jgi:hypothetical protein
MCSSFCAPLLKQTAETVQTLTALCGVGLSFLLVSGLQALMMASPWFKDPRECWYNAAKQQTLTLGEQIMGSMVAIEESRGLADAEQVLVRRLR